MTGIAAEVAAVLERTVLPSVIARGGGLRVAAIEGDVVTLEVTGSPGAALPLASRIEALIVAAVPRITAVRLITGGPGGEMVPGSGVTGKRLTETAVAGTDLADAAQRVLDAQVNPAIAAHRGHVTVTGAADGWIRIRLDGGCQGCSLAEVTIRQGIEPVLRAWLPGLTGLIDVTDHEAGTDPYFSPEKR